MEIENQNQAMKPFEQKFTRTKIIICLTLYFGETEIEYVLPLLSIYDTNPTRVYNRTPYTPLKLEFMKLKHETP